MEQALSGKGRVLAYWQILAGVVSVGIVALEFVQSGLSFLGGVLLAVAVLSLAAGVMLLKGKPAGAGWSWLTQLIQLPALYLQGFHFQTFLILSLDLGKQAGGDFFLMWHAGSGSILRWGDVPFRFAGVNLVALLACLLLALGVFRKEQETKA